MRLNTRWLVVLVSGLLAINLCACATTFKLPNITQPGFGDRQNDYAWGMAWFKGKLYVGTSRNEMCVEAVTTQFYTRFSDPNAHTYSTSPGPGVSCPANVDDLYSTLRAEIWQFDPSASNPNVPQSGWKRMYQSPAIQNPNAPDDPAKTIGRDIAFRGASVLSLNGVDTLVFSGVTAGEFLRMDDGRPRVPAPRLVTTTDGVNFGELVYPGQVDITGWQVQPPLPEIHYPMGFRSLVQIGAHTLTVASDSLTGDGVLMELNTRDGTFRQVSPLRVFEIEVFNNQLYVGTADPSKGYGVYRSDLSTTNGSGHYTFTPVVTGGAGRGGYVSSVISMHPFKGRLYVGACGWYNGGGCELIRINPDDTWDLAVGAGRSYNGVTKAPISGLIDGFGNFFNVHFWRIGDHNGALYVGTNDASWLFQTDPLLNALLSSEYGFDIFGSCDGQQWYAITNNGFLDDSKHNFGARAFADSASPDLAFVGSANHASGTTIYQASNPTWCTQAALVKGGPLVPPARLEASDQWCGTVVSWEPVAGAVSYDVYRTAYTQTTSTISQPGAARLAGVSRSTLLTQFFAPTEIPAGTWVGGRESVKIGSTTRAYFLDRSAAVGAGRYTYWTRAVDSQGNTSLSSNLSITPSQAPKMSVSGVIAELNDLIARGKIQLAAAIKLVSYMGQVSTAVARHDQAGALASLSALQALALQSPGMDPLAADDLEWRILSLARRISLVSVECSPWAGI